MSQKCSIHLSSCSALANKSFPCLSFNWASTSFCRSQFLLSQHPLFFNLFLLEPNLLICTAQDDGLHCLPTIFDVVCMGENFKLILKIKCKPFGGILVIKFLYDIRTLDHSWSLAFEFEFKIHLD